MTSTADQLRTLLDATAFRALESLAASSAPVSGRALARALNISPTTATSVLGLLKQAGFVDSAPSGRARLWYLCEDEPMMRAWLQESGATLAATGHDGPPALTAVIFTALQLEFSAVAARLPVRRPTRVRTTRFEFGAFAGANVDWTVYIAELGPGNTATASEVTAVAAALDPHLLLFVGVAASVKPADLCHGDVIVADRVYNLHSGKDVRDDAEGSVRLARPLSFAAMHGAVQLARHVRRSWAAGLGKQARNAEDQPPRVVIAPIAAGETVHADGGSQLMRTMRRHLNDAYAVDMESFGLYEAAHKDGLPALAVRGISDCVDDKKPDSDQRWQPAAADHAAAFAFALLRQAEAEDFPKVAVPGLQATPSPRRPAPAQLLVKLPPSVALAYQWALATSGEQIDALLQELADLNGRPATWLSRLRHRPPQMLRDDAVGTLWVLTAEFAAAHEHPSAAWLFEEAAQRQPGNLLGAYLYCRAAVAASIVSAHDAQGLLERADAAAPHGRALWAFYRAALGSDSATAAKAILHLAEPLDLPFPATIRHALAAACTPAGPDEAAVGVIEEFWAHYPVFLEQIRQTVTLAAAAVLRMLPGRIEASQLLLEQVSDGLAAYRNGTVGADALATLVGARSSNLLLEMARTLLARAADPASRVSGFDREAALARAAELALTARDRRRDWGGPTGETLAVAAQAQSAGGDSRGALRLLLPPPAGTAEAAEAESQPVVQTAAALAAQTGNIALALELAAKIDDPVERHLATAIALMLRPDSHTEAAAEFRSALSTHGDRPAGDQQIRSLLGLAMVAELTSGELAVLERLDIPNADLIRARSLLTAGQVTQAQILARRYPDWDAALHLRVDILLSQGRTTDAIAALEAFATQRGPGERLLLEAAMLALSDGASDEAVRLAGRVAASTDATRRRMAGEILIDTASERGDWEEVLVHTGRLIGDDLIAEADPTRPESLVKYRWARTHALHQLRRMDEAYNEIRAEPKLEPTNLDQARLTASVLRTIAPSVAPSGRVGMPESADVTQQEVLAAVTRVANAFPNDEELVASAVITAFSMPVGEELDYQLMTRARQLHQQFFEHFPNSKIIQAVPMDEGLEGLKDFLRTQFAPSAQAAEQAQRAALAGQMPLSVASAGLGKNYAEALIRNAAGGYVLQNSDDDITVQEIRAAHHALDTSVVVDTSALFWAPLTLAPGTSLHEYFERLFIPASQRDDILQARISLMRRSSGALGWDPVAQRPVFEQYSEHRTELWARRADELADALARCAVLPDPMADGEDFRGRMWSAPIRLARERGLALVADDAALRAVARSEQVPAFGSLQLLAALVEDDRLPAEAIEEAHRRLMREPVAELPVLHRLRNIAADEQWNPRGYAAFLLTRSITWQPLAKGWHHYTVLVKELPASDRSPQQLADWCGAALAGLSLVASSAALPAITSALVVWTLLESKDAAALPELQARAETVVGPVTPGVDLLEETVQRLVGTVRQIAPADMVASTVLPLLSALDAEAHVKAVRSFFTTP